LEAPIFDSTSPDRLKRPERNPLSHPRRRSRFEGSLLRAFVLSLLVLTALPSTAEPTPLEPEGDPSREIKKPTASPHGVETSVLEEITRYAEGGELPSNAWQMPGPHAFNTQNVTGNSHSKNIPHLRAVAGLMRSLAQGDHETLHDILNAYEGFFAQTTNLEDGSSTYTRWIWPPVVVVLGIANRYERPDIANAAERWLDSHAAKWAIATGWGREGRGFHAGTREGYTPWRPNTYCALARSSTHREPGGPIMWVEFCPNSSFLSLMLGEGQTRELRPDFERPLLEWVAREFGPIWEREPALRRDMLSVIQWNRPRNPEAAKALERLTGYIRYTAPQPVWIWRTTEEVGVFGEISFNNGSTDFLRSKVWTKKRGAYKILVEDYPARQNQGGGGKSRWLLDEESWAWTGPVGRDRLWSLDKNDWIAAPVTWSPSGRKIFLVEIRPTGSRVVALGSPQKLPPSAAPGSSTK